MAPSSHPAPCWVCSMRPTSNAIVFDGPSRVIDLGQRTRFFSAAQRHVVQVRDGTANTPLVAMSLAEKCQSTTSSSTPTADQPRSKTHACCARFITGVGPAAEHHPGPKPPDGAGTGMTSQEAQTYEAIPRGLPAPSRLSPRRDPADRRAGVVGRCRWSRTPRASSSSLPRR